MGTLTGKVHGNTIHLDAVPGARSFPDGEHNGAQVHFYPHPIAQQDVMVFATIFTIVWEEIKAYKRAKPKATPPTPASGVFCVEYASKKTGAFDELAMLTKPNGFWVLDESMTPAVLKKQEVTDEESMYDLCRTLRNGFNHANYRMVNRSPDDYFAKLGTKRPLG